MSEELNLGADHEQSKRLVSHWHDRWAKAQARIKELEEELSDTRQLYYEVVGQRNDFAREVKRLEREGGTT